LSIPNESSYRVENLPFSAPANSFSSSVSSFPPVSGKVPAVGNIVGFGLLSVGNLEIQSRKILKKF